MKETDVTDGIILIRVFVAWRNSSLHARGLSKLWAKGTWIVMDSVRWKVQSVKPDFMPSAGWRSLGTLGSWTEMWRYRMGIAIW
jgi:hypothetical protein